MPVGRWWSFLRTLIEQPPCSEGKLNARVTLYVDYQPFTCQ